MYDIVRSQRYRQKKPGWLFWINLGGIGRGEGEQTRSPFSLRWFSLSLSLLLLLPAFIYRLPETNKATQIMHFPPQRKTEWHFFRSAEFSVKKKLEKTRDNFLPHFYALGGAKWCLCGGVLWKCASLFAGRTVREFFYGGRKKNRKKATRSDLAILREEGRPIRWPMHLRSMTKSEWDGNCLLLCSIK